MATGSAKNASVNSVSNIGPFAPSFGGGTIANPPPMSQWGSEISSPFEGAIRNVLLGQPGVADPPNDIDWQAIIDRINGALGGSGGGGGGRGGGGGGGGATDPFALQNALRQLDQQQRDIATQSDTLTHARDAAFQDVVNQTNQNKYNYNNQLADLSKQYANSMFSTNTAASAAGAYGSVGANRTRSTLADQLATGNQRAGVSYYTNQVGINQAQQASWDKVRAAQDALQTNQENWFAGKSQLDPTFASQWNSFIGG